MFCENCGKRIPDNSVFCPNCGAEQAPAPAAEPRYTRTANTGYARPAQPRYTQPARDAYDEYDAPAQPRYTRPASTGYSRPTAARRPAAPVGGVGGVLAMLKTGVWQGRLTLIALALALVAFISIFLPFLVASAYGYSESINYTEYMSDPSVEAGFMTAVTIIAILFIAAMFVLNRPKLSLIGSIGMLIWLMILVIATNDMAGGLSGFWHWGVGFWFFLLSMILEVVLAFLIKKRRRIR